MGLQRCWVWLILTACWGQDDLKQAQDSLEEHDLASAERGFRAVISQYPENIKAMEGLGWTYHLSGQREAATTVFDNCLSVAAENPGCLRGRASTALAVGDVPMANILITRAAQLAPGDPDVESSLGLFRLTEGRISEAIEIYESLNKRFPTRASYTVGYSEALMRGNRPEDARKAIEAALQQPNVPIRHQAMLWLLRARALNLQTGAVKDFDCADPQALEAMAQWLQEAQRSVSEAQATGVKIPETAVLERQVERRQRIIIETCPAAAEAMQRAAKP